MDEILQFDGKGLYCPAGRFHIDPWRPVPRAFITHAHADHARPGNGSYICTEQTAPILRRRLGPISVQTVRYGEGVSEGAVRVELHPAGHVFGSAQILVEHRGDRAVFSGDYKLEDDLVSEPFHPIPCRVFITECTFGLPIYRWSPQGAIVREIVEWWRKNSSEGAPSVLLAYSLGKAQRLIKALAPHIEPLFVHPAVQEMNSAVAEGGAVLPDAALFGRATAAADLATGMLIAPPAAASAQGGGILRNARFAAASGWMAVRGIRRRRGLERGFTLSDHADWPGLCAAVRATGAERVIATHGYTDTFARWLCEQGIDAQPSASATRFGEEENPAAQHQPEDDEQ